MRKIASILLITILLFNWVGYRVFSGYMQDQATMAMTDQLNNHQYREAQLISIKIPANLPYYGNSLEFERIDGQIEIAGVHYNYVKRRVYKDSLEYMCIPNAERTKIASASNEFYKLVNDLKQSTQNKKSGGSSVIKSPVTDLYQHSEAWTFNAVQAEQEQVDGFISQVLPSIHFSPRELPPDTPFFV